MKRSKVFIVLTVILTLLSFVLSRVIWPDSPDSSSPEGFQLLLFMLLGVMESLGFGIGVSWPLLYWKEGKNHLGIFLSVAWLLASWWPHDNIHRVMDENNFNQLLLTEYVFHATLIIAGFVVFRYFFRLWKTQISLTQ